MDLLSIESGERRYLAGGAPSIERRQPLDRLQMSSSVRPSAGVARPLQPETPIMPYVDGFLLAVPRRRLEQYRRISRRAGVIWRKHGALEYRECAGDDLKTKMGVSFVRAARCKSGEVPVFSWIVYKSRAHRDRVNAKVMKDPWITRSMKDPMPFDPKRMAYGGFRVIVDL